MFNPKLNVKLISGYLQGFEKNPKFCNERCHHLVSMKLLNEHNELLELLEYAVGEENLDTSFFIKIKKNFDAVIDTFEENSDILYKNVPIKIVSINGKNIAITNRQETLFLLLDKIQQEPLNRITFEWYIQKIAAQNITETITYYIGQLDELCVFLKNNPQLSSLYYYQFENLCSAIDEINNELNNMG